MDSSAARARALPPVDYRWAFDEDGLPIPISLATRGGAYTCPLCHNTMIARLGTQLQHHFSHDHITGCTPDAVTRAALRRWITVHLREALAARVPIGISRLCPHCGQTHHANLLAGMAEIQEMDFDPQSQAKTPPFDVQLLDSEGRRLAAFAILDALADTSALNTFIAQFSESVIIAIPNHADPMDAGIPRLMAQGAVLAMPCEVLARMPGLVRAPEAIQGVLRQAVMRAPGYFYAPVENLNGLEGVVRAGNTLLWLPSAQWATFIGGQRNPIAPGVQVLIQHWAQPDGSTIVLYYVTMRESSAVGARRYPPNVNPAPRLDGRFRKRETKAVEIARYLVTH